MVRSLQTLQSAGESPAMYIVGLCLRNDLISFGEPCFGTWTAIWNRLRRKREQHSGNCCKTARPCLTAMMRNGEKVSSWPAKLSSRCLTTSTRSDGSATWRVDILGVYRSAHHLGTKHVCSTPGRLHMWFGLAKTGDTNISVSVICTVLCTAKLWIWILGARILLWFSARME